MKPRQKALFIAKLAAEKKAEDIVILDMRKVSGITDFFIIASSTSTRRSQTISEYIEEGLRRKGEDIFNIEGYSEGLWILIDAYDVVVHIFLENVRKFYDLEGLWADAPRIKICHKKKKSPSKKPLKEK